MERTREIGMLMALGMNKRKIFSMIMLETIFLSIVGAVLGLLISILIVNHFATYGFDLSSVAKGLNYILYWLQLTNISPGKHQLLRNQHVTGGADCCIIEYFASAKSA